MKILLIYHFFYPDPVVSARIFSDFAEDLVKAGHQVTVFTGIYAFLSGERMKSAEKWNGVDIRRFSRPNFSKKNYVGRMLGSAVLQWKWLWAFRKRRKDFDTLILGTDPQFGYLMFPFFRLMNRNMRLIHWVFDVYPEAILASSPWWMRIPAAMIRPLTRLSYGFVDDMVDIGGCMRSLLKRYYHHSARCATLTPWALVAPETITEADPEIRRKFFGDAKVGLLYSGTIGCAHDVSPFIALARQCRERKLDIAFCFAVTGSCCKEQMAEITPEDTNIRVTGFASEAELQQRLAAADIHMVSQRPNWLGVMVPSKFFGSLAMGRPVIFSGPEDSALNGWCREFQVGWRLDSGTVDTLAELSQSPERLEEWKRNAFTASRTHFSRENIISRWLELLQESPR